MPPRLLIVDDEALIVEMLTILLEQEGFSILTALNGRHALEVLPIDSEPTMVLLDLQMPVMTGLEFLEATRASMPNLGPIVIMSANPPKNPIDDPRVTGVVAKPFSFATLLAALRNPVTQKVCVLGMAYASVFA